MKQRNVVIDCDPGVDDAIALLLALRSPDLNILGITTVAGNVPIEKVTRNALVIVEQSKNIVPVYQGCGQAIMGAGVTAEYVHGTDGLGNIGFPDPTIRKAEEHAVDFLVKTFQEAEEPIELITLGPLTNVAMALVRAPEIVKNIKSLVMMAGAYEGGNTTAAAEFNIYVDPEAADIVFRSAVPYKTMVGLEPNFKGGELLETDIGKIESSESTWCQMAGRLLRASFNRRKEYDENRNTITMCDLTAMTVAIQPDLEVAQVLPVALELKGEYTRGMTVVDRRAFNHGERKSGFSDINVVFELDNDKHRKLVLDTFLA